MLALISLLVLPFATLIPVYAKDIFHGTASTFGVIDSIIGMGSFLGTIYLASLKTGTNLNKVLAVNTCVMGAGISLFSYTSYYPLALLFIAVGAFGMMSQITITNTIIQTEVKHSMRGRVISLYAMVFFGMQPLGGLIIGWISEHAGVKGTVLAEGLIAILIGAMHIRFNRHNKPTREANTIPANAESAAAPGLLNKN
ncbi:MAG TPA: MFS transporter, partial [Chitinophagales bacterium]|nr:MFS transporter [Chitinophagales bacterium]